MSFGTQPGSTVMRHLVTLALPFECVVKIGRFEFVFDIFNNLINIGIAICLLVLFLSMCTVMAKRFENDTNIYFHKVCSLSLYDGNLHILQNVMKSDLPCK